jgi:2-polyprenyl-6-methoxyphenol hydroxylase-like FAD-dependent oxidoreductase
METIAVIGGGMAGLAVALAEKRSGRTVTIIERDPPPPLLAPDRAFDDWARPGVPQFRHAHIMLARLQTILRDDHPELLSELYDAGLELSSLKEVLPEGQASTFTAAPEDRDLLHLWGRRATFEYIMRRHVERLSHVRFVHSARAVGFISELHNGQLNVRGVELRRSDDAREICEADIVIDASGRHSKSAEWLRALGVNVSVLSRLSQREYVCRHYRLRDPLHPPARAGGGAYYDFLGYATFYAEHGHFAITLSCPSEEQQLVRSMRHADGFEAVCHSVPVLARWIEAAEPASKVLGASHVENRWTSYGARGGKTLTGFFAVGDSHVLTNPLYGRGCASAFVQAKALSEVLVANADAAVRTRRYEAVSHQLLQKHFGFCVTTDRAFQSRAKLSRGQPIPLGDRLQKYLIDEAWTPAMHKSPLVAREMIKAMQMSEVSSVRLQLGLLLHVLIAWFVSRFRPQDKPRPVNGPPRDAFLRILSNSDKPRLPVAVHESLEH